MRELSLAALTVLELSPVAMVRCAAAAGYTRVGLRLLPATDHEPTWDVVGDTGARLGARHVLVAGNDPDEARLIARLAALCGLAAPLNLSIYLEPMPWTDVRDFTQAARIVAACAQPNA